MSWTFGERGNSMSIDFQNMLRIKIRLNILIISSGVKYLKQVVPWIVNLFIGCNAHFFFLYYE